MRLLAFAASLRRGSWNRKLLDCAVGVVRSRGVEVDLAEFREFDVPLYNADLQEASGVAPGAQEFGRRIAAADGLVLVSPEYNFSLPGTLKNLIDWVSRIRPVPLRGKSAVLLAASPGPFGGIRGLCCCATPATVNPTTRIAASNPARVITPPSGRQQVRLE